MSDAPDQALMSWCQSQFSVIGGGVDVPTLVSFLHEIESPDDIAEYVKDFMPSASQAREFASDFVIRRSHQKGHKATAGVPGQQQIGTSAASSRKGSESDQWQQVPGKSGKGKKKKGGKFNKVAGDVLAYSVSSGGGANRGEIDYGN